MLSFNKHIFFSALAVIVLAIAMCFRFYGDIILHPNEYLFGPSGDGIKNYFTVAYQVIHGEGSWFNGMLHPYGDHLIFADGQPALTKFLSWFIDPDVNNGQQVIGVMNLLMIGSLILAAWCIHRLLVWNRINPWFAVPFSIAIAFLSPQVARFAAHYALGYAFFIPMSWLLMESISRFKFPWIMAAVTSATILLFGFLHPYYLFIFVIFSGAVLGWEMLIKKFQVRNIQNLAARVFSIVVPLLLFFAYQKWADPYTDRPVSPSGMLSYVASIQTVFVPVAEPFRSLFNSYFFRIFIPGSWEGNAYVGMVASFTGFVSLFALAKSFKKRRLKSITHPVLPDSLKAVFVPAVITLFFSMGVFHLLGLQWLSEFISPLKQFRSLGRVAWIFYHVFSVWVVYHLYTLVKHFRSVDGGRYTYHVTVIVGLCAFLWMLDAIVNIKYTKAKIINKTASESFSDKYATDWDNAGVNLDEHQAIMPMPMMLMGSEKIGFKEGYLSLLHSMRGSFSTGLPIVGGSMSRTSLGVTEKTAQLVADPLFPRLILDEFEPNKKLLLLQSVEKLSKTEQHLLDNAELVYEADDYKLFSLSIEAIKSIHQTSNLIADSIPKYRGNPYRRPLKYGNSDDNLWGETAFRMNPIDKFLDTIFHEPDTLIMSFWLKLNSTDEVVPNRILSVDGEWIISGGIRKIPNVLDNWLLISDTIFCQPNVQTRYVIQKRPGTVSRIMLRPAGTDILHDEEGQLFFNNIPLR